MLRQILVASFALFLSLPLPLPSAAQSPENAVVDVAAREGRRNLSFNLGVVSYWSTQQPFLDAMRMAAPWTGHLPGQWGGWGEAELEAAGALDAQGWVLRVPPELSHVSTMVFAEMPAEMESFAGRWIARWEGDAPLGFSGAARNLRYDGQSASFDFTPGDGAVTIEFRRGSLRNLTLVQERYLEPFEEGQIFHPGFLARVRDAESLRFMDWMRTNDSELVRWEDRPQIHDYSWERRGVPLEILIRLANDIGAEPWFTLPHQGDDDLMRASAEMVREDLRPDLRAWVEYSNEVWNWSFAQAHWAEAEGRALWGREHAWVQAYARRAEQMVAIWDEVFAEAPERLVRVLSTQTSWRGLEADILDPPLLREAEPERAPLYEAFDAWAVTGYFSGQFHDDDRLPMIEGWLAESRAQAEAAARAAGLTGAAYTEAVEAQRFDWAIARAGEELLDGRHSGRVEGSVRELLEVQLAYQAEVARRHGLALVMYEGGTHVVAAPAQHEDEELLAFFDALNHSEPMAEAYRVLLAGWAELTPAPFNAYVAIGAPGRWGAWGALRHQDDDSPRWRALMEMSER